MQNKGFIRLFAILLVLVCVFYLSFTFVTRFFQQKAVELSGGDSQKEFAYLDSISTEKVWLGYTFKECREHGINLGLDLKGGMNVILEVSVYDIMKSLSGFNPDASFNQALNNAKVRQGDSQQDFVDLFVEEYHKIDKGARLAAIFSTFELKDKINPQTSDADVISILRSEIDGAISNSFNVLRTRIDRFGVVQPNIQKLENRAGRILIELPGIKEPERVRKLLQGSANLEFWPTYELSDLYEPLMMANNAIRDMKRDTQSDSTQTIAATAIEATATTKNDSILAKVNATDSTQIDTQNAEQWAKEYPLFAVLSINQREGRIMPGPAVGISLAKDTAAVNSYLNMKQVRDLLPRDVSFKWTVKSIDEKGQLFQLIAIKISSRDGRAPLEGGVITDARSDFGQQGASANVSMKMNAEGAKVWARLTKENIGKSIAIVLDGYVYSYPRVNGEIEGGSSEITGDFTPEEAKDLANVLNSGKMPAPATIIQEDVVGPTLGQEAIDNGMISFIVAMILLVLYLLVTYGFAPAMIATAGIALNLFFTMGVLSSFQAVLTLSGIAGMVLSLAMAVDANVLIHERIKEEMAAGKGLKKAIADGYKNAFSAIFDGNLTSILTGIILFAFGTGPIRGFATTLIIGLLCSFFTAVFITRLIYDGFMAKDKLQNLTFTTKFSRSLKIKTYYNFIGARKIGYIVTGVMIVASVIGFAFRGLNQGIEFTGGRNYVVRFEEPVKVQTVEDLITPVLEKDNAREKLSLTAITIGDANQVRISTNYKIKQSGTEIDAEIEGKLFTALQPLLKAGITQDEFVSSGDYLVSSQKVGPSIADDIKRDAVIAIIFAVIAIGLYILLRFRNLAFSVGTIASLVHDSIIIVGVYALLWGILPFSMEIDQTFIGAILTVIGYSVNDTVVIFDRIRETMENYPNRGKKELFNDSLNTTLTRTINTSLSTFIVLLSIFFLAGDAIRSFTFTMIIGVMLGTYSTLYIAAPIAYEIFHQQKRKKEAAENI